jgi:hypothetical protein
MGRDTSPAIGSKKANPRGLAQVLDMYGAGERNRTLDLRITSSQKTAFIDVERDTEKSTSHCKTWTFIFTDVDLS